MGECFFGTAYYIGLQMSTALTLGCLGCAREFSDTIAKTMLFVSESLKQHAKNTILKIFMSINTDSSLLFNGEKGRVKKPQSSAQLLGVHHESLTTKGRKRQINKAIKKKSKEDKRFRKLITYNIIKKHATDPNQSIEEQKYLKKLRQRNINQIKALGGGDDYSMKEIQASIIEKIGPKQPRRMRNQLLARPDSDTLLREEFNCKVDQGLIEMPGLTPGLAPIDYTESDSE